MLRRIINHQKIIQRQFSALYLTGDKAKESYAVLKPFFDFESKLNNKNALTENINNRKLKVNMDDLYEKWNMFKDIKIKKQELEAQRIEIANKLKEPTTKDENFINKLKTDGKNIRENLKLLKEHSYALEDSFVNDYLKLPNEIHKDTPINFRNKIVFNYLEPFKMAENKETYKFHLDYEDLIEYYNETCYYLKGSAAKLDLSLPFDCINYFKNIHNFIHCSNPDFIRTIIGEAAGFDEKDLFLIFEEEQPNKQNLLHLIGNGSTLSFLSYIAKLLIFPNVLPLKLITSGRQYLPMPENSTLGLYSACQSTVVESFIVTEASEECDIEFEKLLENTIEYYKKLDIHFQIRICSSEELCQAESRKVTIEMFSPFFKKYIEVGNIRCYGNYISKRLLFNVRNKNSIKFPHIVAGTVINITKLLSIFLENKRSCDLKFSF